MLGSMPVRGFLPTKPVIVLLVTRLGGWRATVVGGWGRAWSLGVEVIMLLAFRMLVETFLPRVMWERWDVSLYVDDLGVGRDCWRGGVMPSGLGPGESGK